MQDPTPLFARVGSLVRTSTTSQRMPQFRTLSVESRVTPRQVVQISNDPTFPPSLTGQASTVPGKNQKTPFHNIVEAESWNMTVPQP